MMESVPSMAPFSPPDTGASSMSTPRAARSAAIWRVTRGEMVLMSITVKPGLAPPTTPFSPRITCRTSGVSETQITTISAAAAAAAGVSATATPSSSNSGNGPRPWRNISTAATVSVKLSPTGEQPGTLTTGTPSAEV